MFLKSPRRNAQTARATRRFEIFTPRTSFQAAREIQILEKPPCLETAKLVPNFAPHPDSAVAVIGAKTALESRDSFEHARPNAARRETEAKIAARCANSDRAADLASAPGLGKRVSVQKPQDFALRCARALILLRPATPRAGKSNCAQTSRDFGSLVFAAAVANQDFEDFRHHLQAAEQARQPRGFISRRNDD